MSERESFRDRHKFLIQTIAFAVILSSSIGLYIAVGSGTTWMVWFLMGFMLGGMILAMWIS